MDELTALTATTTISPNLSNRANLATSPLRWASWSSRPDASSQYPSALRVVSFSVDQDELQRVQVVEHIESDDNGW